MGDLDRASIAFDIKQPLYPVLFRVCVWEEGRRTDSPTEGTDLFRSEHDKLALDGVQAVLLVAWEQFVSGSKEGVQIGYGTT